MTEEMDDPVFTEHTLPDGSKAIRVTPARPRRFLVTTQLLTEADPEFLTTEGDVMTLHLADGDLTYRLSDPWGRYQHDPTLRVATLESDDA